MNRFLKGDCLDVMEKMIVNGEKFDCVVTDPPYGINHHSNHRIDKSDTTTSRGIMNDGANNIGMLEKSIELMNKLLTKNAHVYFFTRWDKIADHMPMLAKHFSVKNILIWDKGNWGMGDLKGTYGNRYECVIYCMKGRLILNEINGTKRHNDILAYPRVAGALLIHPHQKPVDLLKFLIEKSTFEGGKVLDPFAGIGSTIVAGNLIGREVTGIELDDLHFNQGNDFLKKSKVEFDNGVIE